MSKNKLILNSAKTHLLIMTSARNQTSYGNFEITLDTGTEIIGPGTEEKLLGGHIRNELKWNSHVRNNNRSLINILTSKVNDLQKIYRYRFKIIKRLGQMVYYHSLLLLYKSKQTKKPGYIFSKLDNRFPRRKILAAAEGTKDRRYFKTSLA